jgi:hypothetical protein
LSKPKVYRSKGKEVIKRCRVIPYAELTEVLKKDDEAFLEDAEEDSKEKLKRATVYKAARRLSVLVGHPVRVEKAFFRIVRGDEETVIPGYSFSLAKESSRQRRSRGH